MPLTPRARMLAAATFTAAAALTLSGCDTYGDGYGYGYRTNSAGYYGANAPYYDDAYYSQSGGWNGQPYASSWYDGYYGQIDTGYWASDGYYYYRRGNNARWQRGDRDHFYRGQRSPGSHWRQTRDWDGDGDWDQDRSRQGDRRRRY